MASRTSRLPLAATLLLVAGIVLTVAVIASFLPFIGGNFGFLHPIAAAVLAVALFVLAGQIRHRIAKPALYIAAVGWAVIALASVVPIPVLPVIAELAAGIGGIVAGIIIVQNFALPRRASVGFVVSMVAGALYLIGVFSFVSFAFGVALIVTGLLLRRDE